MENLSLLNMKKLWTPDEFANYLKSKGPIFWWEKGNFWIVTRYHIGKEILKSPDFTADRSSFFCFENA